jgi:hypothetical protein
MARTTIFVIALFVILGLFIAFYTGRFQVIKVDESRGLSFFTGSLFNRNIAGIIDNTNFLKLNIVKVSGGEPKNPYLLSSKSNKYVVLVGDSSIEVFEVSGKCETQYHLEGKFINHICISDMDGDECDEILLLTLQNQEEDSDELIVLNIDNSTDELSLSERFRFPCRGLKPWKIQTSDVDGDGKIEISLGVYKSTPFYAEMEKRPFIYDWDKDGIYPKWRGSRLSRPFDDYIFADVDSENRDEIIAIELLADGSKVLASYSWKGFGFEKQGESKSYSDIINLKKGNSIYGKGDSVVVNGSLGTITKKS